MNENVEKMLNILLDGQKEIAEQVKRIHRRLDEISEKAIVNEQCIKHLEKDFCDEKVETGKKFDIVHASVRRRDGHLKWIVATLIVPVTLSIMAFFKITP